MVPGVMKCLHEVKMKGYLAGLWVQGFTLWALSFPIIHMRWAAWHIFSESESEDDSPTSADLEPDKVVLSCLQV